MELRVRLHAWMVAQPTPYPINQTPDTNDQMICRLRNLIPVRSIDLFDHRTAVSYRLSLAHVDSHSLLPG